MEEQLFIVIWKGYSGLWKEQSGGVFTEERLAKNLVEILQATQPEFKFAYVNRPIVSPETMAEAEARLGPFEAPAPVKEPEDNFPF
jgi:hypothetical protein